jgi:ArsR family transcriptional regulator
MPTPSTSLEPVTDGLCCAPLSQEALSAEQAKVLAGKLKALADPSRLRLLSLILASPEHTACTCDLTEPLGVSQPTVSHHLRKLVNAGLLVSAGRAGTFTYYRAVPEALEDLAGVLSPDTGAVAKA